MIKFDFQDIDWANKDVDKLVEIFSKKFDVRKRKRQNN